MNDKSVRRPAANEGSTAAVRNTVLARYVRAWRQRLDREAMPGPRSVWPSPRRAAVSQEEVASLIGCTPRWFARLEAGQLRNYSDGLLKAVAEVLQLDADETRLLFLLAGKQGPVPAGDASSGGLETFLEAQPWPAYLTGPAWDLEGYNERMRRVFPWVAEDSANMMKWVLTDPEARRRLGHWATEWASPMIAQLRAQQLRYPGDHRLAELVREILAASADARRWWDMPLVKFHPDGDRRTIHLPGRTQPQLVQIVAVEPLRAPGAQLVVLVDITT